MTRRDLLKGASVLLATLSLLRPLRSLTPAPAAVPQLAPDSAFEQLRRLRLDYMLARGNPRLRYDINRRIIALAFEMRDRGASRQLIMTLGQKSLHFAKQDYAALQARRVA